MHTVIRSLGGKLLGDERWLVSIPPTVLNLLMSKGEHHQCQDVEPKGKPKTVTKREGQQYETTQRCQDGVC